MDFKLLDSLYFIYVTLFQNENGFWDGLRRVFIHFKYLYDKRGVKGRFDVYDVNTRNDSLEKMSVLIPPIEDKLDKRRTLSKLGTQTDNILFYGGCTKPDGPRFLVRVSRNSDGLSSAWLYLKLDDGTVYELPKEEFTVEPKTTEDCFVSGALRIRCLLALRSWRISYNGFLRKSSPDGQNKELHHVKFSFLWAVCSQPFDFLNDIHPKLWTEYLAKQEKWQDTEKRCMPYLDQVVQSGTIFGTLQDMTSDGPEIELYLWGARKRSLDTCDPSSPVRTREVFAYAKTGEFLNYGEIKFPSQQDALKYGFIIFSNGLGGPVRSCRVSTSAAEQADVITVQRGPFSRLFEIRGTNDVLTMKNGDLVGSTTNVSFTTLRLDNEEDGHALVLEFSREREHAVSNSLKRPSLRRSISPAQSGDLVLSLSNRNGSLSEVSGGKGSSLTNLIILSKKMRQNLSFRVPTGIVLTTNAYRTLQSLTNIKSLVSEIEKTAYHNLSKLKETCSKVVKEIEAIELPDVIKTELENLLYQEFHNDYLKMRFAVRSSAAGEDSEELSAAGQMTTYLGVTGLQEIFASVMKCWASQFSFIAVEYKRQNGQVIDSPMAVVIHEMVPADIAGVMFTRDPVTGSPKNITITANYGIGESVVSASAEPDTVVLERNEEGLTGHIEFQVGKKNFQIVMSESGGVVEEEVSSERAKDSCISQDQAKTLASIGITIEEAYGCPLDIEWGIHKDIMYLLQARPITTLDKETNFELRHELDNALRSEIEILSTCNIAEVMPGALSFLGVTTILKSIVLANVWHFSKRMKEGMMNDTYYMRGGARFENHNLFSIYDMVLRYYHGEPSMITDCQLVSLFGRLLEDDKIFATAAKRNQYYPPNSTFKQTLYILGDLITCRSKLQQHREKNWNAVIDISKCSASKEAHDELWHQLLDLIPIIGQHSTSSLASSLYNMVVLSNLVEGNKGWGEKVYRDFAYFLGSCGEIESADVPSALEKLSTIIEKSSLAKKFKELGTKEALKLLLSDSGDAGDSFREFLQNHGHRGYKEFDMQRNPWGTDPEPLIKTLQEMVGRGGKKSEKKPMSISETLSNLSVPLSRKNKLILRVVIPLCRGAVGMRETSKSIMIKTFDAVRKAYRELAQLMVREGRLPDAELIYYLTHVELDYLIKTRSPLLIQKAIRRRNVLPLMDKVVYPEIMNGIPRAVNYENHVAKTGSYLAKGVPVSNGIAEGPARVATTLEEAADIKPGEILIAYSTDIGWSPYFPMLAGVATEIGGLISHGAVVAREYGLPCIVGVEGATLAFKTGDHVILNGSKGTLERLE